MKPAVPEKQMIADKHTIAEKPMVPEKHMGIREIPFRERLLLFMKDIFNRIIHC